MYNIHSFHSFIGKSIFIQPGLVMSCYRWIKLDQSSRVFGSCWCVCFEILYLCSPCCWFSRARLLWNGINPILCEGWYVVVALREWMQFQVQEGGENRWICKISCDSPFFKPAVILTSYLAAFWNFSLKTLDIFFLWPLQCVSYVINKLSSRIQSMLTFQAFVPGRFHSHSHPA